MAHESNPSGLTALHEDPALIVVENESFAEFERRMDEQLARLVAQWIHTAAPNAQRAGRSRKDFGR